MDTIDQDQLKNQRYIIRFGHTKALLLKKKDHILAKIPVLGNLTHIESSLFKKIYEYEPVCLYSVEANCVRPNSES